MSAPLLPLQSLDSLWFQVAGTRCNLTCEHCFISCSPKNDSFGFLTLDRVRTVLREAVELGVKEYYFTGGEPFLNREMVPILELTLQNGPATVLTNGTVLKRDWLTRLRAAEDAGVYGLEFRVSIDGPNPETNDPVRGPGTFDRALRGVGLLLEFGFLPIITMTRIWDDADDARIMTAFRQRLAAVGYDHPRMKILPRLQIGAEAERTCGYETTERITETMLDGYDVDQLVCSRSRIVTDRGVAVCPILIESPDSHLGETVRESMVPYRLRHGACYTCYRYGAICSNTGVGLGSSAE